MVVIAGGIPARKVVGNLEYSEYATHRKGFKLDFSMGENFLSPTLNLESRVNGYGFTQDPKLIKIIASKLEVKPENILITAGCDFALHHIAETFLEPKDVVVIPNPTFPRYYYHSKLYSAKIHQVYFEKFPYEFDLGIIKKRVTELKPKITFLCNPNNPTGHYLPINEIENFVRMSKGSLIAIDEALADYTGESASRLVNNHSNLLIARSFSKLYGLAGLRIGYVVGHKKCIKEISKLISPFEVSTNSIDAAKQVLGDEDFTRRSIEALSTGMKYLKDHCSIRYTDSKANIILLDAGDKSPNLYQTLIDNEVLTIDGKSFYGLGRNNCIRVCVKDMGSMRQLVSIINQQIISN